MARMADGGNGELARNVAAGLEVVAGEQHRCSTVSRRSSEHERWSDRRANGDCPEAGFGDLRQLSSWKKSRMARATERFPGGDGISCFTHKRGYDRSANGRLELGAGTNENPARVGDRLRGGF